MTEYDLLLRPFAALLAGGLIGLERTYHGRAAGVRTYALVSLGAALLVSVAVYGFVSDVRGQGDAAATRPSDGHRDRDDGYRAGAGGRLAEGAVEGYPNPVEPTQITLRHHKVNELLGTELKPHDIEYHLGQLGLKTLNRKPRPVDAVAAAPEPVTFRIPTFRVDLKRETDLIEEVCRLHGVDKIPATPPRGAVGSNAFDAFYDQIAEARRILIGLGLRLATEHR